MATLLQDPQSRSGDGAPVVTGDRIALKPQTPRAVVQLSCVRKGYRRGASITPVLDGVDLTIRQGECVFLVGPSGSGKTTLLSIIGCVLSADRGRVVILDEDLSVCGPDERNVLRRDRIGFVFQRFHLIRGLSAQENVAVPLTLRGTPSREAHARALELLRTLGMAEHAKASPANLSAGQCQRVALARALANDPDLILADEPTASLDAANGQQVMTLLHKATKETGKTAIVVTHDPRIFCFADRVLHVENGQIAERDAGSHDEAGMDHGGMRAAS